MHLIEAKELLSADNGMNLYRGCTHGCIYCDSRSRCYRFEHPFEDVAAKVNAPELLDAALRRKRKTCMIGTGSMSDPYLPLERELRLTRRCLERIAAHGFGLSILTKSARMLDDLPLLTAIRERARCVAQMTVTTFDDALCALIEPGASRTGERLDALQRLRDAGVPAMVWLAPILPFINDTRENVEKIMRALAEAGVCGVVCFGMGVTLREGSREYFYA
ncbi:MAG: radical SAM protein, partial [Clostridia bacterium]|nr:radical SAM protein [Clostridia bacterium]